MVDLPTASIDVLLQFLQKKRAFDYEVIKAGLDVLGFAYDLLRMYAVPKDGIAAQGEPTEQEVEQALLGLKALENPNDGQVSGSVGGLIASVLVRWILKILIDQFMDKGE